LYNISNNFLNRYPYMLALKNH